MSENIQFNRSAIRASECIGEGWNLIKPDYWLFFGISILGLIIGGCIPCISIFLAGPIQVGIYYALFTKMRGAPVEFGMMFKGFEKFVPAMVIGIIAAIPQIISEGGRIGLQFSDLSREIQRPRGGSMNHFAQTFPDFALSSGLILIILLIALAFIIFAFVWRVVFFFALPLIAEHDLSIGDAISISAKAGLGNAGGLFLLFVMQFLVALVGVLMLCIGVFFVIPIIHASSAVAFRQVFPDTHRQPFNNAPPRPEAYGGSYGTPV